MVHILLKMEEYMKDNLSRMLWKEKADINFLQGMNILENFREDYLMEMLHIA